MLFVLTLHIHSLYSPIYGDRTFALNGKPYIDGFYVPNNWTTHEISNTSETSVCISDAASSDIHPTHTQPHNNNNKIRDCERASDWNRFVHILINPHKHSYIYYMYLETLYIQARGEFYGYFWFVCKDVFNIHSLAAAHVLDTIHMARAQHRTNQHLIASIDDRCLLYKPYRVEVYAMFKRNSLWSWMRLDMD